MMVSRGGCRVLFGWPFSTIATHRRCVGNYTFYFAYIIRRKEIKPLLGIGPAIDRHGANRLALNPCLLYDVTFYTIANSIKIFTYRRR